MDKTSLPTDSKLKDAMKESRSEAGPALHAHPRIATVARRDARVRTRLKIAVRAPGAVTRLDVQRRSGDLHLAGGRDERHGKTAVAGIRLDRRGRDREFQSQSGAPRTGHDPEWRRDAGDLTERCGPCAVRKPHNPVMTSRCKHTIRCCTRSAKAEANHFPGPYPYAVRAESCASRSAARGSGATGRVGRVCLWASELRGRHRHRPLCSVL
jgi:hypothetical protein